MKAHNLLKLFTFLTGVLSVGRLAAQNNEVYLNQGEIGNNAILVEPQRVLISTENGLAFWDIDKSLLLKSYNTGNQFTSGVTQTLTPAMVSPQGNFLVCTTADSVFIYQIKTQQKVKAIATGKANLFGNWYRAFSADEKRFVSITSEPIGAPNIQIWDTANWEPVNTSVLNQQFKTAISTSAAVIGNNLVVAPRGGAKPLLYLVVLNDIKQATPLPLDNLPPTYQTDRFELLATGKPNQVVIYLADIVTKQTYVGLYDTEALKTIRASELPIEVSGCYSDLKNNLVVFCDNPYLMKQPEKGFHYIALNISSGEQYDMHLPDVIKDKSGYFNGSYADGFIRNGHFMMRSHVTNKIDGINLSSHKMFSLDGAVKYDRMIVGNDHILYRTKANLAQHQYTLLNTVTLTAEELQVTGDFLPLSSLSLSQSIGSVQREAYGRYVLSSPVEDKLPNPVKLIETHTSPIHLAPIGRSGNEYVFRLGRAAQTVFGQAEFDDDSDGGLVPMNAMFGKEKLKYLIYNLQNNKAIFTDQYYAFENFTHDEGYFRIKYINSYGFAMPDSVALIDNRDTSVFGSAGSKKLNKFFGDNSGSLPLAADIHFNQQRTASVFRINDEIYLAFQKAHQLDTLLKISLNRTLNTYALISKIGFCNNGKSIYCLYTGSNNQPSLQLFDLNLKPVYNYVSSFNRGAIVVSATSTAFLVANLSNNSVELHYTDKVTKVYPFKNQKILGQNLTFGFCEQGNTFFTYEDDGNLAVYNLTDGHTIYQDSLANIKPTSIVRDKYFTYIGADGIPAQLEFKTRKITIYQHPGLVPKPIDYNLNFDGDSISVTTSINTVVFWNKQQTAIARTLLLVDSGNVFALSPLGYYSTGKSNINEVLLRHDTIVSPIRQRDLLYNRPSYFIQAPDTASALLKQALETAYQKRLRYYGVTDVKQVAQLNNDKIYCLITNATQLNAFPAEDHIKLDVATTSASNSPVSLHVTVNNVPIYGVKGIATSGSNVINQLTIPLSDGKNAIAVFATDATGQSSNIVPLIAEYKPMHNSAVKLHFVGIGINHFAEQGHNLQWSVKDIRDLALKFKQKYNGNCTIDTLFDQDFTPQKFAEIKKSLLKTAVNDKVVLAYSGHGLLSNNYDYFLSAYNVNFDKPEQGGLPYNAFESLLDSIPARNKLMLIDACHSGEIDKEEVAHFKQVQDTLDKGQIKRGAIIKNTDSTSLGTYNTFALMQQLFANLGQNTGTTIIAAAEGTQYALEKGDLKNGVFTYSILENMEQNQHVTLPELKQYVNMRVSQLTHGLQLPTTRNEADVANWQVW